MSRSPLLLGLAWVTTCFAALTCGLAVRLAPVEKTFGWPTSDSWPAAASFTSIAALVLGTVSLMSLVLLSGSARQGNRPRPFAELLVFYPLFFAFVWFLVPVGPASPLHYVIGSCFALAAIFLIRHTPGTTIGPRWSYGKKLWLLDGLIILLPLFAGFALGNSPDLKAGALSLLLYPLYALIQLAVFLYIPVTRLRALGLSRENASLLTALVFSLVHWPNPLVMLATLGGMLLWAHQFQKGRPLWQLAVVMGLTATTFTQFLPDDLTGHMRVGPGRVRSEAVVHLAETHSLPEGGDNRLFMQQIYPQTIGRTIQPKELEIWISLVEQARRSTWTYMFLNSDENRKYVARTHGKIPPPAVTHWTAWPQEWKNTIARYASHEFWQANGENSDDFLRALYREILGRVPSQKSLDEWDESLSLEQSKRLAEVLLQQRLQHGLDVFAGMSVEELQLPN